MRVRNLEVNGIRGLGEQSLSFADSTGPASIVAITGPPASGKTTVLETLIAAKEDVGAYGAELAPKRLLAPGLSAAKIRVGWQLDSSERDRFRATQDVFECETLIGGTLKPPPHEPVMEALLSQYHADPRHGKVEYFHAHRQFQFSAGVDLSKGAGDTFDRNLRLAADNAKYASLIRFIVSAGLAVPLRAGEDEAKPGRVTRAFGALCKSKRLGGLYREGDAILPGFVDGSDTVFGVGDLSDSELDALLFATTFVRSGLLDNGPGSVVLIDTPERHFGDAAGALVQGLLTLGINNQLIVATNSKSVVDVAGAVIRLHQRGAS